MATQPAPLPLLKVTDMEGQVKSAGSDTSSNDSHEQEFIRIPLDGELVVPQEKQDEEEQEEDQDEARGGPMEEGDMSAQDMQNRIEERFFATTPTTTESRTDCEINTSQVDSSGLDELPLKKEARQTNEARGFQQRIRSQGCRLRAKIRNISRPKINLPERPKINLPQRPKFNFPERLKFNLPERPKFNLPKRPQISMPNFNFGKNKTSTKTPGKTSSIRRPLRDRNQTQSSQSTEGSKKNIFDTLKFRTYPRIFSKKKKGVLDGAQKRAQTPPPRMETESTPPSSPASRKGPFNQRWTHRLKDIKFADDENQSGKKMSFDDDDVEDDSAPFCDADLKTAIVLDGKKQMKAESSSSIPGSDREQRSSGSSSERHRAGVIEEIDSDEFFLREKGLSREDVDVSRYLSLEIRDAFRSPKNALARLDADIYDDDEDYDFEPARRAPGEPIRRSMEAMRRESIEPIRMTPEPGEEPEAAPEVEPIPEPIRPERTRSLRKRSTRSKSEESRSESQFNTFPPNRPNRGSKKSSHSKVLYGVDPVNDLEFNKDNITEGTHMDTRQPSIPSLAITDTTKEFSPTRYIDESSEALDDQWQEEPQPPLPPKRRKSAKDLSQDNESLSNGHYTNEKWLDEVQAEVAVPGEMTALQMAMDRDSQLQNGYYDSPPLPPSRKQRSRGTSLADEDRTSRGADSLVSEMREQPPEDEEVLQEINVFSQDNCDYAVVEKTVIEAKPKIVAEKPKPIRPPPPSRKKKTAAQITALKNQSINFFFTYPRRAIKKSFHREPQIPIRPIRNYSTLGPARPPRKNRVFREPVYEGEYIPLKDPLEDELIKNQEEKSKSEIIEKDEIESAVVEPIEISEYEKEQEITNQDEIQESKDLQSGDVIEKMKSRPLPPPPRPPRKSKDDSVNQNEENTDEREVQITDLDEPEEVIVERIDIHVGPHPKPPERQSKEKSVGALSDDVFYPKEELDTTSHLSKTEVSPIDEPPVKLERKRKSLSSTRTQETCLVTDEVSVCTQTDPLPEGFLVEEEQQTIAEEQNQTVEASTETVSTPTQQTVQKVETVVEHKVIVIPTPETEILKTKKLHVTELDVERLNVGELQAQKITVSDIDGVSMQVSELTSKSGHLVVSGFELPPSFLEAISPPAPVAPLVQTQSSTQTPPPPTTVNSQTNTTPTDVLPGPIQDEPIPILEKPTSPIYATPSRPSPPPSIVIQSPQGQASSAYVPGYIPQSMSPPRSPPRSRAQVMDSEEELRLLPRRRRHHSHKHSAQYSSDEEEEEEFVNFHVARRHHQREPTASELVRQLFTIWQNSFLRGVNHVIDGVNVAFPEGEKRKDAQTAACIILVLIAGLMMIGLGSDKTVHHHHWDFLPPHP